jgi:arabinose-5-phosphate isomerase
MGVAKLTPLYYKKGKAEEVNKPERTTSEREGCVEQTSSLPREGGLILAQKILSEGQRVLRQEALALTALAAKLDASFCMAVELLAQCSGKVVLSGVGKSGFIARKIASTMSSLGVPAIFMHPTEAVHGDMGALAANDLLVAVSHSGNSEELLAFLEPVGAWLGLSVIAITGRRGGSIDNFSTVVLETGVAEEACALGLAPTSSSTAALALGDALAVCASQVRGVGASQFARWHPSGSLGRRLYVRVKEIMRKDYTTVGVDASLDIVVRKITQGGLGLVIVRQEGEREGIITDGDVRRAVLSHPDWATKRARDIMSSSPYCIEENALALDALALMESRKITSLIVTNVEGRIQGVAHLHDILSSASLRLQSGAANV